jgi:hypothetical protein
MQRFLFRLRSYAAFMSERLAPSRIHMPSGANSDQANPDERHSD